MSIHLPRGYWLVCLLASRALQLSPSAQRSPACPLDTLNQARLIPQHIASRPWAERQ
ncbi:MAG TPA: hypothetical protein V6D16_10045 [Candidatus Obscuribacterales bacterium]